MDFGNSYAISGVQTNLDISGQNWTKVAAQLNNPNSAAAMAIDGAANIINTAICTTDEHAPARTETVCDQTYATLPLAYQVGKSPNRPNWASRS